MNTFPNGVFVGKYKGVNYYTIGGEIQFLLGWMPQRKRSIRAAKVAITKWRNS